MRAYPDSKCAYGYMVVCDACKPNAPKHVDTANPIMKPPAVNKTMPCEMCGKPQRLTGA
jgi:hypothetical protein